MASKAYGYVRVSTAGQVEDGQSLENQQAAVKSYFDKALAGASVKWGGVFVDRTSSGGKRGVSGRTRIGDRPAGGQMVGKLEKGDHVVFNDLSRGFRNFADAISTIEGWMADGITVHLVREGVTTGTAAGKLYVRMMALFAQTEREMASERTKEVMAMKKRLGEHCGGPAGYGWRYEGAKGSRRKVADEQELEAMRRIDRMVSDEGMTYEGVYRQFLREGVVTRKGKAWSLMRIHRAHMAHLSAATSSSTSRAEASP